MAQTIRSIQRLFLYLIVTLILTIFTLFIFHQFIASSISLPILFEESVRIIIILLFAGLAFIIIRRFKPFITQRIGNQFSTIIQYFLTAVIAVVVVFGILNILQPNSATELITGAGIISITVGLVISTFVGSLLSGFLVFTNYKFKVGDNIMFNNIPGKIIEMTALVLRIQTDVGQVTIPNNAVASGGVIITVLHEYPDFENSRLHYRVGDRVLTSYNNEQGIVKEITALTTTIQLDSNKQITFQNNMVLSGAMLIAKITSKPSENKEPAAQF
jgi:small-conductance mechanosensitive channel